MPYSKGQAQRLRRTVSVTGAGVLLAYLAVAVAPLPPTVRSVSAFALLALSAVFALVPNVLALRRTGGRDRTTWAFLIGVLICTFGAMTYALIALLTQGQLTRSPSPDDVLYLGTILFMLLVSVHLGIPVRAKRMSRAANALDFTAILGTVFVLGFVLVLEPMGIISHSAGVTRSAIMAAYFTLPIAIAVFPLVFREDPWPMWTRLVTLGLWCGVGNAIAAIVVVGRHHYFIGSTEMHLAQAFIVAGNVCYAAAAAWCLAPSRASSRGPHPAIDLPRWPGLVVLTLAVPGLPLAFYYALESTNHFKSMVVGLTSAAAAAVLMARSIIVSTSSSQVAAARQEVAHYRALVETAPIPVLVVDDRGLIAFANEAVAQTLEARSAFELIGFDILGWIGSDPEMERDFHDIREAFREYRATDFRPVPVFRRVHLKTLRGNTIQIERTAIPINYAGRPAMLIQGVDVTERVLAEQRNAEYGERLRALTAELVSTEEREHRRLSIALHDQVTQQLAVARIRLKSVERDGRGPSEDLEIAIQMVEDALREARDLTVELAPSVLYELGLVEALRWLCGNITRIHKVPCASYGIADDRRLDDEQRALLFRSVRELANNAVKHSNAHSISIQLSETAEDISVAVIDDGAGFDATELKTPKSFGLLSVRESLAAIGGSLEVDSSGGGTCAIVTVPAAAIERASVG